MIKLTLHTQLSQTVLKNCANVNIEQSNIDYAYKNYQWKNSINVRITGFQRQRYYI